MFNFIYLASAAVLLNIKNARTYFEKLERSNENQRGASSSSKS